MAWGFSDEIRIDIDKNELEKLTEHGQLKFPLKDGYGEEYDLRLVYHDEDHEGDQQDVGRRTFG